MPNELAHVTSLPDTSGKVAGAAAAGKDLAEDTRPEDHANEDEQLLRLAMGAAKFGAWSLEINEDRIRISDSVGPMLGLAPGQGPRRLSEFLDAVAPEAREALAGQIARMGETGIASNPEFQFTHADGSIHWAKLHTNVYLDASGKPARAAGIVLDITQHKNDAIAIAGALRALKTLSAVNAEFIRAPDESALLRSVCKAIVEQGRYAMAWVGVAEGGPGYAVRPVAQYGCDDGYLARTKISWDDTAWGQGPTGRAVRLGETQINQDVVSNPFMEPWREAAIEKGFRSSIALPLKSDLATFGVLSLYASEPAAFGDSEVRLLNDLAAGLAFGIGTMRAKAEHFRVVQQNRDFEASLRQGLEETVQAISTAMEMRDAYTHGHQKRVGALAVAIAREIGLPDVVVTGIRVAAGVHDIGKITIPAELLTKSGKLRAVEYQLMQGHAEAGREILKDITFPWPIADIVWQHHERLDGSGYPRGLRGDGILLEARVIAVADVVEAMASHRPYRPALGMDAAMQEIARGRGKTYDSTVVDACLRLCRENRFAFPE